MPNGERSKGEKVIRVSVKTILGPPSERGHRKHRQGRKGKNILVRLFFCELPFYGVLVRKGNLSAAFFRKKLNAG